MFKTITFKNVPIHFTDNGSGKAVVLLHGFLENLSMWKPLMPVFENRFRVISVDLLGHGQTGCVGYVHTMEEQAAMVKEVLKSLQIEKAFFIGHSMGGYIALALAELHPELFQGLVLLNSTSKADSKERVKNRDRAIVAVKENYRNFVRISVANLFGEDSRPRLQKEIEQTQQEALKTPVQGIVAALEGMKIRKDRGFILKEEAFPILLVLGKKDGVLPYEETSNQIKNTKVSLKTLSDGHMSHLENTQSLIRILNEYFAEFT